MAYLDRYRVILRRVQRVAQPLVVEVGVDIGELSEALLRHHESLRLIMVDRWRPIEPGSAYAATGDFAQRDESGWRAARDRALSVAAAWPGRAVVLEGDSAAMAAKVSDGSADLVFIDAAHDDESVRADIAAWRAKVRPGGWLGGHDYLDAQERGYGVRRAVDAAFGDRVALDFDDTWWVKI